VNVGVHVGHGKGGQDGHGILEEGGVKCRALSLSPHVIKEAKQRSEGRERRTVASRSLWLAPKVCQSGSVPKGTVNPTYRSFVLEGLSAEAGMASTAEQGRAGQHGPDPGWRVEQKLDLRWQIAARLVWRRVIWV